jgi:hypothetical protein
MVMFNDFAAVAQLDGSAQRQLLHSGTPEEQVWAAWSLGLERGRQANAELLAALERIEHTGVRQHLVVMLAGLGERSLLEDLAEQEMDEAVRATASQYLLTTGTSDSSPRVRPLLEALLHDPSPKVRRALLVASQSMPERATGLTVADLTLLVADSDSEVRDLAIEALLRQVELERLFPGVLEDRLPIEPDIHLRRRLMHLAIGAGRSRHLLTLASESPQARMLEIVEALHAHRLAFLWNDLAPFVALAVPVIDYYLVFLLDEQSAAEARSWLLAQCTRTIDAPYPPEHSDIERYNFSTRCYVLLERALQQTNASSLSAEDRSAIAAIREHLEALREQLAEASEQYEVQGIAVDWSQYDHIQRRFLVLDLLRALDDDEHKRKL